MRNFAKMALMSENSNRGYRTNMGYDMENRSGGYDRGREAGGRATRGTLTWDNTRGAESAYNGGYGSMNGGQMNYPRSEMYEPESRRRRDSRERFRSEMDGGSGGEMYYPGTVPPIYEEYDQPRQIGFSAHGGEPKEGLRMIRGGAHQQDMELDEETAHEWMENLQNEDGTKGPHWPMEQTKQVMAKRGFDFDPLEWWVALNAMYSDYAKVAKKHNVNNIDFYADLAKAWLHDADAVDGKTAAYYQFIVK